MKSSKETSSVVSAIGTTLAYILLVLGLLASGTFIAIEFNRWWIWLIAAFFALVPSLHHSDDKNKTENNMNDQKPNTDYFYIKEK